MPKMLLVTDKFGPHTGGTAVIYSNWCSRMNPDDIVVLTCCLPYTLEWREFDNNQNFRIYRVPFINIPKIRIPLVWVFMLLAIPFIVIKEKPDIIHAGQAETSLICILTKYIFRKKYVIHTYGEEITFYSTGSGKFLRSILAWSLRQANVITTISIYTKSRLIKLGLPSKRIRLLYPGVDLEKFKIVPSLRELRDKYKLSDKKVLLTIARLMERKGHDMVVKALPKISHQIPNITYMIVGDGKEEKSLKKLAKQLKLEKYVIFVGRIPNDIVPCYYYLCDVFIMPNRMVKSTHDVEGFGIVFLEANACGKPVIGGRSGGAVDAIADGITGILVNPYKLPEIEDAIMTLFKDSNYALKLGENGKRRVETEFTWESAVNKILEINSSLL